MSLHPEIETNPKVYHLLTQEIFTNEISYAMTIMVRAIMQPIAKHLRLSNNAFYVQN